MGRGPSFEARPAEKPDPHRFLLKHEGAPAGMDVAKRRASAGSPGSPKIAAAAGSSPGGRPASPSKRHASKLFWRLYDRWVGVGASAQCARQPGGRRSGPSTQSRVCTRARSGSTHPPESWCRGDLPVLVDQARPGKNGIRWKSELEAIDLHYYLPVFVDGCVEAQVGPARGCCCTASLPSRGAALVALDFPSTPPSMN